MDSILVSLLVFLVLFLLFLGSLSWTLWILLSLRRCNSDPHFWCSDNWTCKNSCSNVQDNEKKGINGCFASVGPKGLASCLFGPDSQTAKDSSQPGEEGGVSWPCEINNAQNCFNGCPKSLEEVPSGTPCCGNGTNLNNGTCQFS